MLNNDQIPLLNREQIQAEFISLLKSIIQDQDHTKISILIERTKIWETILPHDEYIAMANEVFERHVGQGQDQSLILWLLGTLKLHTLFEKVMNQVKKSEAKEIDLHFRPQENAGMYGEISLAAVIADLPPSQAIYLESILKMKNMYLACLEVTPRSAFYLFKYAISCNKSDIIRVIKNHESFMNQSLPTPNGFETPFEIALNIAYVIPEHTPMPFMSLVALCKKPDFNRVLSSILMTTINDPENTPAKRLLTSLAINIVPAANATNQLSLSAVSSALIAHKSAHANLLKPLNCHQPTLLWLLAKHEKWVELLLIIKKYKDLIFNTAPYEGEDQFQPIAILAAKAQQWQIVDFILDAYYLLCKNNPKLNPAAAGEIEGIFHYALQAKLLNIILKILSYFPHVKLDQLLTLLQQNEEVIGRNPQFAKLIAMHGTVLKFPGRSLKPAFIRDYKANRNSILMTFKKVIRTFLSEDVESTLTYFPLEIRELMAVHALKLLDPDFAVIDNNILIANIRRYHKECIPQYDKDFIVSLCLAELFKNNQRIKFRANWDLFEFTFGLSVSLAMLSNTKLLFDKSYRDKVVCAIGAKQDSSSPSLTMEWCTQVLQNLKNDDGTPLIPLKDKKSGACEERSEERSEKISEVSEEPSAERNDNYSSDKGETGDEFEPDNKNDYANRKVGK